MAIARLVHVWSLDKAITPKAIPDSKVHRTDMEPIWDRQDPDGPHVCPMNLAIWDVS